jgi:hypothetical protein
MIRSLPRAHFCSSLSHCCSAPPPPPGNFKDRPEFQKKFASNVRRAFSLVSPERSLDLVCQTREDMEAWKKMFYRSGFPLKNAPQVQAHRRRIEKKKTVSGRHRGGENDGVRLFMRWLCSFPLVFSLSQLKRLKLEKAGKSVGRIESSDSDYEKSADEAEEKSTSSSSGLFSSAASSSSAVAKDGNSKDAAEERKARMRAAAMDDDGRSKKLSSSGSSAKKPKKPQEEDD